MVAGKRTEEWNAKPKYPDAADRFLARKEEEQAAARRRAEKLFKARRTFEDLDPKDPYDQLPGVDMGRPPW
ncbi:MAG TPA: hypothetical protein VKW08_26905 [Xanthobacteraceae bacterium]|nr:hypothetical protein [Xanthobacteraceae bacterium]